jgi:hypothetical protein
VDIAFRPERWRNGPPLRHHERRRALLKLCQAHGHRDWITRTVKRLAKNPPGLVRPTLFLKMFRPCTDARNRIRCFRGLLRSHRARMRANHHNWKLCQINTAYRARVQRILNADCSAFSPWPGSRGKRPLAVYHRGRPGRCWVEPPLPRAASSALSVAVSCLPEPRSGNPAHGAGMRKVHGRRASRQSSASSCIAVAARRAGSPKPPPPLVSTRITDPGCSIRVTLVGRSSCRPLGS